MLNSKILVLFLTLLTINSIANEGSYFLISEVDTSEFNRHDLEVLNQFLSQYHQTDDEIKRLSLISDFLNNSYEETTWVPYNEFMISESWKLANNTSDELLKKEAMKFYGQGLNNKGFVEDILGNPDEALNWYNQSLSVFNAYGHEAETGIVYNNIGYIKSYQGDLDSGLSCYFSSLQINRKYGDYIAMAIDFNNIGSNYDTRGDVVLAFNYYDSARYIQEKVGSKGDLASTLNNLGYIYGSIGDTDKCLEHYYQALEFRLEIGDNVNATDSYLNIGTIYMYQGKYDEAKKMFDLAFAIATALDDYYALSFIALGYGTRHFDLDQLDSAESQFNKAIYYSEEINLAENYADAKLHLAQVYQKRKNHTKAIALAKEGLDAIQETAQPEIAKDLHWCLYKNYVALNNSSLALKHLEKYRNIEAGMNSLDRQQKVLSLDFKRKLQSQKERDSLKTNIILQESNNQILAKDLEISRSQMKLMLTGILGLSALTIAFILFRSNKQKQKDKELIQQKSVIISEERDKAQNNFELAELNRKQLAIKNKEILDSITYAKRLQEAVLPPQKLVKEWLTNSFILYKPKEIVSGDFYWMESKQMRIDEKMRSLVFFAAADCTGHGVPGAMLSVICAEALNRAVSEFELIDVGEILEKVSEIVIQALHKNDHQLEDGMDIALCGLDLGRKTLYYSGANNPLWILSTKSDLDTTVSYKTYQNEFYKSHYLHEVRALKKHIGFNSSNHIFKTNVIQLVPGDAIYVFSDGLVDQFGGSQGKKFKYQQFRDILLEHANANMDDQKKIINQAFEDWKGDMEQVDDICIIGVKINGRERQNFTKRELEVLEFLNTGLPSKLIADKMNISTHTVDTYRRRLLAKTNTFNTTELINYCKEKEII